MDRGYIDNCLFVVAESSNLFYGADEKLNALRLPSRTRKVVSATSF